MSIFLEILITIALLFLVMLLVFCGYILYSYIIDDLEKRERKRKKEKQYER
jgi:hypothetical protein